MAGFVSSHLTSGDRVTGVEQNIPAEDAGIESECSSFGQITSKATGDTRTDEEPHLTHPDFLFL
jgi:hypothetical protein